MLLATRRRLRTRWCRGRHERGVFPSWRPGGVGNHELAALPGLLGRRLLGRGLLWVAGSGLLGWLLCGRLLGRGLLCGRLLGRRLAGGRERIGGRGSGRWRRGRIRLGRRLLASVVRLVGH